MFLLQMELFETGAEVEAAAVFMFIGFVLSAERNTFQIFIRTPIQTRYYGSARVEVTEYV